MRTCALRRKAFAVVDTWLADQRALWEGRTDRLESFVTSPRNKDARGAVSRVRWTGEG